MYHLNFSPRNSGLVVFVLYPYGGGVPVGYGSAYLLFLAPTATSSICLLPLGPFSLLLGSVVGPAMGFPCAAHFVRGTSI